MSKKVSVNPRMLNLSKAAFEKWYKKRFGKVDPTPPDQVQAALKKELENK